MGGVGVYKMYFYSANTHYMLSFNYATCCICHLHAATTYTHILYVLPRRQNERKFFT